MPLKNHNLRILSSLAGKLFIIIGDGPLPGQWQTLLPTPVERQPSAADKLRAKAELKTLAETLKPRAIIWQATGRSTDLANEIKRLPKEIPLLIRYPHTLETVKDKKLLTVLRSRANNLLLSRPLRFWPPTCRVWEICAGRILGRIEKIELTLNLQTADLEEKKWTISDYDLVDFCSCLLDQPVPADWQRRQENPENNKPCLKTCFSGQAQILIKYLNPDQQPGIGLEHLTVVGRHGVLDLRKNTRLPQDEQTDSDWSLERSFNPWINRKELRPLPLSAPDPIALELKYFLHQMQL